MNTGYTIDAPHFSFDGYPFPYVRVDMRPELGVCAVVGYSGDGAVQVIPNVTPRDTDTYETSGTNEAFWIDAGLVYGISWRGEK